VVVRAFGGAQTEKATTCQRLKKLRRIRKAFWANSLLLLAVCRQMAGLIFQEGGVPHLEEEQEQEHAFDLK
jgi:hypothetical protein